MEEAQFHDKSHSQNSETRANSKFYSITKLSKDYYYNWIKEHSPGKVVLDYACGNGGGALRAAISGAQLAIGLDISRGSIENARRSAEAQKLSNCFFVQGDCENSGLPDNSIDIVLCSGMLHHLDLSYALPELRRIMKPGVLLLATEALNYNPIIKLYRKITPKLRTKFETEHILNLDDLKFASRFFEVSNIRYWHLFSILAVPFRRIYFFSTILEFLNMLDKYILRIPLIRKNAWQFTFELKKRKE